MFLIFIFLYANSRPNIELVVDDVDAHLQQEALNLVDNINKVNNIKCVLTIVIFLLSTIIDENEFVT